MTDLLSRWSRLPRNNNICLTLTFLQRSLLQMQYYKFYSIRSLTYTTVETQVNKKVMHNKNYIPTLFCPLRTSMSD